MTATSIHEKMSPKQSHNRSHMQRHISAADKNLTTLNSVTPRYDSVPFSSTEEPLFIRVCFSHVEIMYVTQFGSKCSHKEEHLGKSIGAVHTTQDKNLEEEGIVFENITPSSQTCKMHNKYSKNLLQSVAYHITTHILLVNEFLFQCQFS